MAIEDTKFVSKLEAKAGGRSGTYWVVTWTDGKTDRIFDGAMKDKLEEAQANTLAVHYSKEKHGNYFNIVSLELVKDELPPAQELYTPPPEHPEPPAKSTSPQEIGMWWKELGNRIGDSSLERDYPKSHVKIKGQYYKKMSEVTGVNFKE
jgi:hypothetical protein